MSDWLDSLKGVVPENVIAEAKNAASENGDALGVVFEKSDVSPRKILSRLSRHWNIPCLEVQKYHPDKQAIDEISEEIARKFKVLPLFSLQDKLYVALTNPDDLQAQDYLRQLTGMSIEPVLAAPGDLDQAINRCFLAPEKIARSMGAFEEKKKTGKEEEEEDIHFGDEEAPAIKLLNYIISHAINLNASDIHLEPFPDQTSLRYRIDGVLHRFPPPPPHLYRALITRIKIISSLDVAERRLPQDGRTTYTLNNRDYDLRISIIPNLHGEGVVMRILDTEGKNLDLEEVGFPENILDDYSKMIKRDHGIILVTGPTGSGKTTTLYASLKRIYSVEKKMITLEDPVEYQLKGIIQVPIRADIGFTFARGLRSILRHDPDIIMLGEIRDLESAEIAVRSSLTGHLVFSTLHTNNAPAAIARLIDMGLPVFLVFSSLVGVLAQRLVRRLCPRCKEKVPVNSSLYDTPGLESISRENGIYSPVGCTNCAGIGYKGRTAIFELMKITRDMRKLSEKEVTPERLKDIAQKHGFMSLAQSALKKLESGVTSLEEVISYITSEAED